MKLYGLFVAQNEGDVIEDTLDFLRRLNVYEKIFFYDLGSEDDTFQKALQFKDILHDPQVLNEVYTEKLRYDLLAAHRNHYQDGDWVAIIDADEFYADNPRDLITYAENEGANCIKTYQVDFMFTDLDLKNIEKEHPHLPIYKRRKYYLIDWSEERFYKYLTGTEFLRNSKVCSKKLLNRHYQYRTPEQIALRIKTRTQNKKRSAKLSGRQLWLQIFSHDWRDYVVSHKVLHRHNDDGDFQFGIPNGVEWKDYYSVNPYCHVVPQMAEAISQDRCRTQKNFEPSIQTNGRDPFSKQVKREIHDDLFAGKWKSSFAGIIVLLRFRFRILLKQLSLKYFCVVFMMKNFVNNFRSNIRRFLSGKSVGILFARPNPIVLPDISGAGVTTLTWRCLRSNSVEIHVDAPDGPLLSRSSRSGKTATGKWVLDQMVFFLQDVSNDLPLTEENTIAKIPVVLRPDVLQKPVIGGKLPGELDER